LDESSFLLLTPREYDFKCRAYHRKREREWEQVRFIAWSVFMNNANRTKKDKKLSPSDLVSLSIDRNDINPEEFKEEMKEGMRQMKPILKRLHEKRYGKREYIS
jgi:hypothetical protein